MPDLLKYSVFKLNDQTNKITIETYALTSIQYRCRGKYIITYSRTIDRKDSWRFPMIDTDGDKIASWSDEPYTYNQSIFYDVQGFWCGENKYSGSAAYNTFVYSNQSPDGPSLYLARSGQDFSKYDGLEFKIGLSLKNPLKTVGGIEFSTINKELSWLDYFRDAN